MSPRGPPPPPWASLRGCRGRGALHGVTRYPLQGPPKPALWALLLALLGAGPGRAGLRSCSVPDVLHHYRAVIFEDLQAAVRWMGPGAEGAGSGSRHHFIQKNLTGAAASGRQGRVGASCGAQKVWRRPAPSPWAPPSLGAPCRARPQHAFSSPTPRSTISYCPSWPWVRPYVGLSPGAAAGLWRKRRGPWPCAPRR